MSGLAGRSGISIRLTVNGRQQEVVVDPRWSLLQVLREALGLTGTHFGCLTGHCGACTVLLGGLAVKACTVLAASAEGQDVVTIEGLAAEGRLHPLQQAFWEHHALQCGYCTPGMILTALDLLRRSPAPSAEEVRVGLAGTLCRCTGYDAIVEAVLAAARATTGAQAPATRTATPPGGRP